MPGRRASGAGAPLFVAAERRADERPPVEDRDLTDPDDIEAWMAELLRDWQLTIGASELGKLLVPMRAMLENARRDRAGTVNDLRREGYHDGQVNVLETLVEKVERAVAARLDRIGEAVRP